MLGDCDETAGGRAERFEGVAAARSRAARSHGPQHAQGRLSKFVCIAVVRRGPSQSRFLSLNRLFHHASYPEVWPFLCLMHIIHSFRFTTVAGQYGCHKDALTPYHPVMPYRQPHQITAKHTLCPLTFPILLTCSCHHFPPSPQTISLSALTTVATCYFRPAPVTAVQRC